MSLPPNALAIIQHDSGMAHDTGPGHPERIDRLNAVADALAAPQFAEAVRIEAPAADISVIDRVHLPGYAEAVLEAVPEEGMVRVDGDTVLSQGSGTAALHAAGGAVLAVDQVLSGAVSRAFLAMRPPGHHAEPAECMGFCIFNNVAVGAAHALEAGGLNRVAIVDFDVHHGNGTQTMAEADPRMLYISLHEFPLFPGTGLPQEQGAHGNIMNIPIRAGSDGETYRRAFEQDVIPRLTKFEPELLFISAGFDADARDPLAGVELGPADFHWMTEALSQVADSYASGRIVSVLEGGYDLDALREGVSAHLGALLGQDFS
ncbi:MAG: histone deacetylase family protein [Alphaproteobacteria bacterium]|nr:histone deacetylase family protein [Alphaproteobacteria bacterium SS10]